MSLVVVGINHRTAPVDVRERVVFDPAHAASAARIASTGRNLSCIRGIRKNRAHYSGSAIVLVLHPPIHQNFAIFRAR